jgi:hypothetical protein
MSKHSTTVVITFYDKTSGVQQKVHSTFETPENEELFAVEVPGTSRWGKQKRLTWKLPSSLFLDITKSDVQCSLFLLKDYLLCKNFLLENLSIFIRNKQQKLGFDDIDMINVIDIVNYTSGGKGHEFVYEIKNYVYSEIVGVLAKNAFCEREFNNPFNGLKKYNLHRSSKKKLYNELYATTWKTVEKLMSAFIFYESKNVFQMWVHTSFSISDRKLETITNRLWGGYAPYNF